MKVIAIVVIVDDITCIFVVIVRVFAVIVALESSKHIDMLYVAPKLQQSQQK